VNNDDRTTSGGNATQDGHYDLVGRLWLRDGGRSFILLGLYTLCIAFAGFVVGQVNQTKALAEFESLDSFHLEQVYYNTGNTVDELGIIGLHLIDIKADGDAIQSLLAEIRDNTANSGGGGGADMTNTEALLTQIRDQLANQTPPVVNVEATDVSGVESRLDTGIQKLTEILSATYDQLFELGSIFWTLYDMDAKLQTIANNTASAGAFDTSAMENILNAIEANTSPLLAAVNAVETAVDNISLPTTDVTVMETALGEISANTLAIQNQLNLGIGPDLIIIRDHIDDFVTTWNALDNGSNINRTAVYTGLMLEILHDWNAETPPNQGDGTVPVVPGEANSYATGDPLLVESGPSFTAPTMEVPTDIDTAELAAWAAPEEFDPFVDPPPSSQKKVFGVTIPLSQVTLGTYSGGSDLTLSADLGWYEGTLRNTVHAAIIALVGASASWMVFEEFRRTA
jgi:hypothetical protein